MTHKVFDYAEPFDRMNSSHDGLPPPSDLVSKEDTIKVTISLSKASVEFFKEEAKKHGTQYQKMIRKLLDLYVRYYDRQHIPNF
jgi:predicted DNA binding CopG/RHH family protein